VFDETFFGKDFAKRAGAFSREHGGLGVRVEFVTRSGERLDVLTIKATKDGATMITRDDRMVFLPYAQIAHVDVALLRDHRIAAFEFPTDSE
jgi:hypothetical protein